MEYITSALDCIAAFFASIDYTPLKHLIDLNDARNLAAIVGVVIAVYAASKKWGNAAIYQAQISFQINRPARISNLSLANLKDKPLIVYRILASFEESKSFVTLRMFQPPLVIEGLQATSIEPDDFSSLDCQKNPFADITVKMDIMLVTESTVVKCKPAKIPESLVLKHMKGFREIGKSTMRHNGKVYTDEAAYALVYRYKDADRTSFILHGGHIIDEWPFRIKSLSPACMADQTLLKQELNALSEKVGTPLHAIRLP